MDALITLIRFPFGVITSIISIVFLIAVFPFETVILIPTVIFVSIFLSREEAKDGWWMKYPHSLRNIPKALRAIWKWVADDY